MYTKPTLNVGSSAWFLLLLWDYRTLVWNAPQLATSLNPGTRQKKSSKCDFSVENEDRIRQTAPHSMESKRLEKYKIKYYVFCSILLTILLVSSHLLSLFYLFPSSSWVPVTGLYFEYFLLRWWIHQWWQKHTIIYFLSHFISKGLFEVFEKPALTHILLA